MDRLSKDEVIDEINELLDSLSPALCTKILRKLTLVDLVNLKAAVQDALKASQATRNDND